MSLKESEKFFVFVRYLIGNDKTPITITPQEWYLFFYFCQKQAITGVIFDRIKDLSLLEMHIPKDLLYEWIADSEQIREQNKRVDRRCIELTQYLLERGFRSCILKGQGNALMYPNPYSRVSGDIDIWVEGNRRDIEMLVRNNYPHVFENYHHIDFPLFDDVPVEVHFTPGTLTRPKYNKRFQQYVREHSKEEMKNKVHLGGEDNSVCVSTLKFNVIYQMVHMMVHFFDEGVGLRHFIDYYYVLKFTREKRLDKSEIIKTMQSMGLAKFASGVMWIEKNILGLKDDYIIINPSEKIGKVIFHEIVEGGNFGQYDKRYALRKYGYFGRGISDTVRLLRLFTTFPSESIWKIIWKAHNQRWKIKERIIH